MWGVYGGGMRKSKTSDYYLDSCCQSSPIYLGFATLMRMATDQVVL